MINAPQIVIDKLKSGNVSYANLVTVNLGDAYDTGSDVILHLTDHAHAISFNGNTYTPDNNLTEIAGISRKASTGSDSVDIVFSVTDSNLIDVIRSERYINKPTSIDRVLIDNGNVIGDFSIPIRTAWGISHSISGDVEDRAITLTIDSVLGDLDGDNGWYAVNASHEQRYAGDKIMKHGQTVMTEEQQKKYTTDFTGVINQQVKPPALAKIYGYRNVELVPICMLKHRKTHTSYRHYFTTLIYAINIGDCDFVDINNLKKDGDDFDYKVVTDNSRDVGGWSVRVRTPTDAAAGDLLSYENSSDLSFWFEGMDSGEKARMTGMYGKGLTLLFVKNRNRDNWLQSPPKLTLPVRGAKVYDPRSGLTVFSRNPALQYADFLRSTEYGAGKRGIPVTDANISTLADHFDQIPDSIGNDGINSILIDVQLDTGEALVDNMNIWMEGVRLYTSDYYGTFNVRVETKTAVSWVINEDDLDDFPEYESGEFTDRINQLTYTVKQLVPDTSPDAEVGDLVEVDVEATFPPDGDPIHTAWLAEDGGIQNFDSEQLSYVTELEQAYYWAMVDARISRKPATLNLPVGILGWLSEVGDVIQFSSPVMDSIDELWRIDEVTEDDESVELKCVPYDANFYTPDPNAIPTPAAPAQPPTGIGLGAVSGLSLIEKNNKFHLTWNPLSSANVSWYAVEVTKDDVLLYDNPKVPQPPFELGDITIGSYVAKVTPIGINDEGDSALLSFSVDPPEIPTINTTVSTFEIEVTPTISGSYIGVTFELKVAITDNINVASNRGLSGRFTLIGLAPSTTYFIWVRTVSIVGESDWAQVSVTTLDGQVYRDLIDELEPIDITEAQKDIEQLYEDVDELIESMAWRVIQSQQHTTEVTYTVAETKENNEAIATETAARATQGSQLQASIDNESVRVTSLISRVDGVEVDISGNASAISAIQGVVDNPTTGMSATYTLAQSAKTTADGSASATTVLSNQVNNSTTGLSATNLLAQSAKVSADNNALAVTQLQSDINNIVGISLADITVTNGSNVVNVNSSEDITGFGSSAILYVDDNNLNVASTNNATRTITLQSNATFDSVNTTGLLKEGAASTAELQLAVSGNTADITTLKSQFSLTGTVEAGGVIRVVGIKGSVNAATSVLEFFGDKVKFVKQDGTPAIYLDILEDRFKFDGDLEAAGGTFSGELQAASGDFEGTVKAGKIIGEQASGNATVLSGVVLTTSFTDIVSFTIEAEEWDRTVIIPCPWFLAQTSADENISITVEFRVGNSIIYSDGLLRGSWGVGYFSASPRFYTLLANVQGVFKVRAKLNTGSDNASIFSQGYSPSVFKKSNEITFN